jgi:glycolate oxidase
MALKRDVYRALEDIVGEENISEDPADLHAYAFHFGREFFSDVSQVFCPLAEAILLPGNTEEVQAIVKACNRYGVRFKPMSTGWGMWNAPGDRGAIQLDMRRMDRILEINEKNMYAVVEPYVISARLQAELMKRGLNFNIIGAGSNTTAMGAVKMIGYGFTGASTGIDNRNVLGIEWVMPNGEIVRTGSSGSGAGYFYGEGPGPGIRGLMRGMVGACGGMGVCTKSALKLYHWPGPAVPEVEGRETSYSMKLKPDMLMKLWYAHFPSIDKMGEALYKIAESDICFVCNRYGIPNVALALVESNQELVELWEKIKKEMVVGGFSAIIAANSRKEFAYGEKVFRQILAETDGKTLPLVEEPRYQAMLLWHIIRASSAAREAFRATGTFTTTMGSLETIDFAVNQMKYAYNLKKQLGDEGKIFPDLEDWDWGNPYEGGHTCHIEAMLMCHPNPHGLAGLQAYFEATMIAALDPELKTHVGGIPLGAGGEAAHNAYGPANSNYHLWMRKLKKEFDPNGVTEANFHITTDDRYKDGLFKFPASEG